VRRFWKFLLPKDYVRFRLTGEHASDMADASGTLMLNVARFERRGVKLINLPGSREKYGETLAGAFKELREYMRDNVISVSKVTEEQPPPRVLLPRDSTNTSALLLAPLN